MKKLKLFLTLLVLVTCSMGLWATEGDELGLCQGTGSGYGTRRTSTDSHSVEWVLASGQSGYLGVNSATNQAKVVPTEADLPVVKAVKSDATTTTTGYYFYYTTTAVANVGSIQISYTANSGNSNATAYVVCSSTAAAKGSATWSVVTLDSKSPTAQNASLGTSGTFTYKFNATETNAMYYGVVIVSSTYKRMTAGTIKLLEGATGGTPTCAKPTFTPADGTVFYTESQGIEIACTTADAAIHYTLDGSTPTASSTLYDGAFDIDATTTIKAIAVKTGNNDSEIATATITKGEPVTSYDIDFEKNALEAYVNWAFDKVSIKTGKISAHGGTYYAINANSSSATTGTSTAAITTKAVIAHPGTITFYTSKESGNTTASSWKVQVSADGTEWEDVKTFDATEGDAGDWTKREADLSDTTDVYVRIAYDGSTAIRAIDDISLTQLYPITVEIQGSYVGKIRVNGSDFTQAYVTVWVADNTEVLNIEAKPDPGYNFKEWHIQAGGDAVALGSTTALSTTLSSSKIAVVQALFEHVCDYVDDFPTYLSTSNETHESAKIQWQWVWYPQSSFTKRVERYRVLVKETESGDVVFNDDVTFTQEEMEASSSVNHTVTGLKPVTEYSYWIWSRPTDDGFSTLGYCEDGASTDERTFTTNKAPAEIAWPNKKDTIYTVGKVRVPQTLLNPNNLPVTYESSSEYVATIDENTGVITPVNGGYTTTIWAFTEGDETHTYASVSYTLYVANPSAVKISGAPTKTTYELGETIDPTGLVAQVVYSDETLWTPESGVTFTFTPATIVEGQETAQAQAHWSDMDSYWSDSFDAICKKHHVTVADGIENGTVVVKDGTAKVTPTDFFYKGKQLTIEATPADAHYALDKIYVNGVEHEGTTFEIPAGDDFVVSATFKHVKIDAPIHWYSDAKVEKTYGAPEWLNPFTWRTLVNEENLPVTVTSSNTDVIETMLKDDYNHWYPEAVKAIGTTIITATFAGNDDYNPTVVSYELEILKANAGLAWSAASAKVKKGAKAAVNVFPTLTKPSDLTATITYSSTDEDVAKIDANGVITLVADGETTIKAKFENDEKYADAEVSYTLTVEPQAVITVTPALLDYGKVKTGTAASALDLLEFKFSSAENLTSGRAVSIVAPAGFSTSANELWPEISQNYGVSVYVKDATLSTAGVYEGNVVISTNDLEEDIIVAVKVTVEDAYAITEVSEGGHIEWNGSTAPESAFAGAVYTLVAKPNYSHEGGTIKVYKASDESEVPAEVFDGTTLTMPAYAIKVVATFLLPAANISWENTDKIVLKYGQDGILAQDNWKMLNNNSYFTVSVTSSNTDVIATMNGTSSGSQRYVPAEILGVGTTTITATFAGNDTYRETSVSYEVEIQKGDAGLAWSADENIVAYLPEGVKAYELPTLSNPHDFAVSYTSGNESVATINETTGAITLVGEGASLIKASFAGNDLYASKEVAYILHVEVVNANFYVTGSGDALGNWSPAANPSYADTKVLHLAAGDYELKVVDSGDWKGFEALTSTPAGLSAGDNDNICFTLDEEGDVTVTYIKGSTFTVTGNFHVELPTKFYIAGSMTDWDANKIAVKADSYVLHLAAGHHQIKVVDGSKWKGFEDLTTKEGLYTDEWGNVAFTLTADADVTVTYTGETFTVASAALGEPTVKLVGFGASWNEEDMTILTSNGDGTASCKINVTEGRDFKLIVNGNWLGWSYDDQYWLTRTNTSVNNLISQKQESTEKEPKALYLNKDQAGEYTFTYNYVTRVLSVTFPEIPEPRLQNGYYLQLNGITVDDIEVTDKFTANSANEGEYLLADVTLHVGDKVKVISIVNDAIAWEFPKSGDGYEVDAAHAGVKTIYFNPDYQSGWADPFGGYIWIDANGGETGVDELNAADKAVKSLENGLLIIRRGDKSYNAQGQLIK